MNLFGLPEPVPRAPRKYTRTPSVIRLCWISEGDELCFADSAPMPEWRARALVERVSKSDHDADVQWFHAAAPQPEPDGFKRAEMPHNARVELLSVVPNPEQLDINEARKLLRSLLPVTRGPVRSTIEAAITLLGEVAP